MKRFLRKYWYWIAVSLLFVGLILFGSDPTIFGFVRTKQSVKRLSREIERYELQIKDDSTFVKSIEDDQFLEKYAREKHLMHAADEQLFIIE